MMGKATFRVGTGLTTRRLLVALLFVAIFAMAVRQPVDSDTWWQLKSGQLMWETGQVLRTDAFSHTVAGQPWLNHGWLTQIILWLVYRAWNIWGLALLLAAIVTASFALVYIQCEGRPFVAAFVVLLAVIASSIFWNARPQIISLLLAALITYLLDRYKQSANSRWLWPLPLLMILWVNCHGAFVVAFILLGCYLVGETLNRLTTAAPSGLKIHPLVIVVSLSVPAVLFNPNTVSIIPYAYQTFAVDAAQDFIIEWASPNFHSIQFHPFLWLLLLTLAAMGLSRRRADWTDLALVCVFSYMGLMAARTIPMFALVTPPILSRYAVATLNDQATTNPRLSWLGMFTHTLAPQRLRRPQALLNSLLLVLVLAAAGTKVGLELIRIQDPAVWGRGMPVAAAEYLRDHDLPGPMLNTYNWGGYLIWSLYPNTPVFVDGRADPYAFDSQALNDYVKIHWVRPGWQQVLDQYRIGFVITERTGLLDMMLAETEEWRVAYSDDVAIVYVRAVGSP